MKNIATYIWRDILLISMFSLYSCIGNTKVTKELNILRKMSEQIITFPEHMETFCNGQVYSDILYETLPNSMSIVVFCDSSECSSCQVAHLSDWNGMVDNYYEKFGIRIYFIFSPSKSKLPEFLTAVERFPYKYPILLDTCGTFHKKNPFIPANPAYHIFLLDFQDRILIVGNPIYNREIGEMYRKTIDSLVCRM